VAEGQAHQGSLGNDKETSLVLYFEIGGQKCIIPLASVNTNWRRFAYGGISRFFSDKAFLVSN
jgi:hypothetical protein